MKEDPDKAEDLQFNKRCVECEYDLVDVYVPSNSDGKQFGANLSLAVARDKSELIFRVYNRYPPLERIPSSLAFEMS